jgi:hypothetical protein
VFEVVQHSHHWGQYIARDLLSTREKRRIATPGEMKNDIFLNSSILFTISGNSFSSSSNEIGNSIDDHDCSVTRFLESTCFECLTSHLVSRISNVVSSSSHLGTLAESPVFITSVANLNVICT